MLKWTLIAVGGAFGSLLRYAVQGWAQRLSGGVFPTGTMVVNMSACLAIGLLAGFFAGPAIGPRRVPYRIDRRSPRRLFDLFDLWPRNV